MPVRESHRTFRRFGPGAPIRQGTRSRDPPRCRPMKLLTFDELPESADAGRAMVHMAAFGGFLPRKTVATWRRRSSFVPDYVGIFAVERGQVLGQVFVQRFAYTFPHGTETVSGPAGVATRRDFARAGIARRMLEEVHRREREEGIAYSTLWTNRSWGAHRLYDELGYRDIYEPPFAVHVGPRPRPSPSKIRVRGGRRADIEALESLHERFAAGRWGFAHRERGRLTLAADTHEVRLKEQFLVAVERGVPVGYAQVDVTPFRTVCGELVARPPRVRARLAEAVEARAGAGAVAFRDSVVDTLRPRLRRRGYVEAPAGWFGLMGMPFGRTARRATVVRAFGAGSSKFLCFTGDRF
jgi:GNAT superfamily N-acetyltransferase